MTVCLHKLRLAELQVNLFNSFKTCVLLNYIFECHNFFPFWTVHGVFKARILKCFAIPFSNGPHFVRALHHDLSILGGPTGIGS